MSRMRQIIEAKRNLWIVAFAIIILLFVCNMILSPLFKISEHILHKNVGAVEGSDLIYLEIDLFFRKLFRLNVRCCKTAEV